MVRSKSSFVAPILSATPASWIISAAPWPTMWQPEDAAARRGHDQLHQHALLAPREDRVHRPEGGAVDLDLLPGARLGLGHADGADLGLGEDRRRHQRMVGRRRGGPRNTVSAKAAPSRIATGVRARRSVTSPTAWIDGTEDWERVHQHRAVVGPSGRPRPRARARRVRHPAGRVEHAVGGDGPAVLHPHLAARRRCRRSRRRRSAGQDLDALGAHLRRDMVAAPRRRSRAGSAARDRPASPALPSPFRMPANSQAM